MREKRRDETDVHIEYTDGQMCIVWIQRNQYNIIFHEFFASVVRQSFCSELTGSLGHVPDRSQ